MATFITAMDPGSGDGPLLAVKDLIDVAGVPTTAGSRALAEGAVAATDDAPCMAGARARGARVVGKANLVELAFGASGTNEYFGTPVNPLDAAKVPGGSSSGSAVAVATGAADVAYGSDTGGSIRVPSAFCGTAGLKTTRGRIPLGGVWPLAPSFDTVGPMARDVEGLVLGMRLLEPGFTLDAEAAETVGRLRLPGIEIDPAIEDAVDEALAKAGLEVVDIGIPDWSAASEATIAILEWEAAQSNRRLIAEASLRAKLDPIIAARLDRGARLSEANLASARSFGARWSAELVALFERVPVLAGPTVAFFAPLLEEAHARSYTVLTSPVNLAGLPALALPVPTGGALPASLQLIAASGGESLLLATGSNLEHAVAGG
jgi:amidase